MKVSELWNRARTFVMRDAWMPAGSEEHGMLARTVRVGHHLYQGYRGDDLTVHATSLTFGTLTSLVPILAVAIAVMRGFGMGNDTINGALAQPWYQELPEGLQTFIGQILGIVTNTNFFALGWIGLIFFILTAVFLLSNVERSFNRVWGVEQDRDILSQVRNYTCVLVLVPLLIGMVVGVRARVAIQAWRAGGVELSQWGAHLVTFLAMWTAVFCLFMFVPNTRVRFRPALWSSALTTAVFLGWMKLFTVMQIGVAKYNYIYGAFAAIPIFMFWLYVTWVILLLGAEFTFALQNADTYEMEGTEAGMRAQVLLAVLVMRETAGAVRRGGEFDADEFSRRRKVPIRLVNATVYALCKMNYLVKVAEADDRYVLKRSAESVRIADVVRAVVRGPGEVDFGVALTEEQGLAEVAGRFDQGMEEAFGGDTVASLLGEEGPSA